MWPVRPAHPRIAQPLLEVFRMLAGHGSSASRLLAIYIPSPRRARQAPPRQPPRGQVVDGDVSALPEQCVTVGTAFAGRMLKCRGSHGARGELTVRVADLCAAGGHTLIVEVCEPGSGLS